LDSAKVQPVDDPRIDGEWMPVTVPVHAVDLGESLVLYDPAAGRAHVLNSGASRIWAMLDGATSVDTIVAALVAHTGADAELVGRDVRSSIARFRTEGLFGPAPVVRPADDEWSEATGTGGRRVTLSLLDRTVSIATRSDLVADALDWWSEPLRSREPAGAIYDADVLVDETTVRVLPAHVNRLAARSAAMITLHAAGVVAGDRAVVLPGVPDAGKSTLVTALVQQGLGYMSDEVVGLALTGGGVAGYPKRISLELGSWALFPDLDGRASHATHPAFDPTRVRWYDARDLQPNALAWRGLPLDLGLVVVPRYAPDEAPSVARLDPVEAMSALLGNAFNLPTLGGGALGALRDAALAVPCYRLVHQDSQGAAGTVRTLMAEHGIA
jgi:hypothetical protein